MSAISLPCFISPLCTTLAVYVNVFTVEQFLSELIYYSVCLCVCLCIWGAVKGEIYGKRGLRSNGEIEYLFVLLVEQKNIPV